MSIISIRPDRHVGAADRLAAHAAPGRPSVSVVAGHPVPPPSLLLLLVRRRFA